MKACLDSKGNPIREYDVLRVFHYYGARHKKVFMYKWVSSKDGELFALHLNRIAGDGFFLWPLANGEGRIMGMEVVQTQHI